MRVYARRHPVSGQANRSPAVAMWGFLLKSLSTRGWYARATKKDAG